MIRKIERAKLKPMKQWATSPKTDLGATDGGKRLQDYRDTYRVVTFDPAVHNSQDIGT
uniref:Uncharacterized protein n=1 Tax=Peronospora matthiolae TaxID=2874970 RepID=A0AAV1V2S0_9STRA